MDHRIREVPFGLRSPQYGVLFPCRSTRFHADPHECRTLLENDPLEDAADHVVEAVHRKGWDLLYVVSRAAAPGLNRVALPAAVLTSRRKVAPKIVSFRVAGSCVGEILVPEETRLKEFPGARSVRIRFCQPPGRPRR